MDGGSLNLPYRRKYPPRLPPGRERNIHVRRLASVHLPRSLHPSSHRRATMDAVYRLFHAKVMAPLSDTFNSNVYVTSVVLIIMNMGSSYLMQDLVPLANRMFAYRWVRRIVFFAIMFTSTRNLAVSILLTLVFTLAVDVLLNESSAYCLLPYEWRQGPGAGDGPEERSTLRSRRETGTRNLHASDASTEDMADSWKHVEHTPEVGPHHRMPVASSRPPFAQSLHADFPHQDTRSYSDSTRSLDGASVLSPTTSSAPPTIALALHDTRVALVPESPSSPLIEAFRGDASTVTREKTRADRFAPRLAASARTSHARSDLTTHIGDSPRPGHTPPHHAHRSPRLARFRRNASRWHASQRSRFGVRV